MKSTKRNAVAAIADEHTHQSLLFEWALWAARSDKALKPLSKIFAIPNGGHRNKVVAGKLKKEGLKPGVPDIMLPVARCGYHGLFIEMKKIKRSGVGPSEKQEKWIADLIDEGYKAVVCYGFEEAKAVLIEYLKGNQ